MPAAQTRKQPFTEKFKGRRVSLTLHTSIAFPAHGSEDSMEKNMLS